MKLTQCIEWTKGKSPEGYGQITRTAVGGRRPMKAHRFTWQEKFGPIPKGLCVLHLCDNRACINIDHLALGTHKANSFDMLQKGRHHPPKGEMSGRSKLTVDQVQQIKIWLSGGLEDAVIARRFGVTTPCIRSIRIGRTWKHLEP